MDEKRIALLGLILMSFLKFHMKSRYDKIKDVKLIIRMDKICTFIVQLLIAMGLNASHVSYNKW